MARLIRTAGLSIALAGLLLVGRGPLRVPLAPRLAWAWAQSIPPVDVAFALLRLLAIVAGGYLLAGLLLVTVADLAGHHRAGRLGRRMLPVSLHQLLAVGAGTAALTAALAPAALAGPPTITRLGSGASPPTLRRVTNPPAPPVPTTLPGTGAPVRTTQPSARAPARSPDRKHFPPKDRTVATRPSPRPVVVTIRPGDSFWSIAARHVEKNLRRPPTAAEVAPYWHRLIAANAGHLPIPNHPDVLFPGDRVILPT